jgi:hypothetical protein
MKDMDQLGEIINAVMEHKPATFESFDNYTLELSIKFFFLLIAIPAAYAAGSVRDLRPLSSPRTEDARNRVFTGKGWVGNADFAAQ